MECPRSRACSIGYDSTVFLKSPYQHPACFVGESSCTLFSEIEFDCFQHFAQCNLV